MSSLAPWTWIAKRVCFFLHPSLWVTARARVCYPDATKGQEKGSGDPVLRRGSLWTSGVRKGLESDKVPESTHLQNKTLLTQLVSYFGGTYTKFPLPPNSPEVKRWERLPLEDFISLTQSQTNDLLIYADHPCEQAADPDIQDPVNRPKHEILRGRPATPSPVFQISVASFYTSHPKSLSRHGLGKPPYHHQGRV